MPDTEDKIMFQFVMSYKAYRRGMIIRRASLFGVLTLGSLALCVLSIMLGIVIAVIVASVGAIAIIVSLNNECTYTVYTTRVVLKKRGEDKRVFVPIANILSVKYKSAFYEKSLKTGTVTITAATEKGGTAKYKLKHIFNAKPAIEYLNGAIREKQNNIGENGIGDPKE